MAEVALQIIGGEAAIRKLQALGKLNFRPEFEEIGKLLVQYYSNDVFLSQGGVFGKRWQPLEDDTVRAKIRGAGKGLAGASPTQPEVASGDMQANFYAEWADKQVRVANRMDYFKYQQLGTQYIPARVMIDINASLKSQMQQILNAGVRKRLAEA